MDPKESEEKPKGEWWHYCELLEKNGRELLLRDKGQSQDLQEKHEYTEYA